jgi:hypothetical protein
MTDRVRRGVKLPADHAPPRELRRDRASVRVRLSRDDPVAWQPDPDRWTCKPGMHVRHGQARSHEVGWWPSRRTAHRHRASRCRSRCSAVSKRNGEDAAHGRQSNKSSDSPHCGTYLAHIPPNDAARSRGESGVIPEHWPTRASTSRGAYSVEPSSRCVAPGPLREKRMDVVVRPATPLRSSRWLRRRCGRRGSAQEHQDADDQGPDR